MVFPCEGVSKQKQCAALSRYLWLITTAPHLFPALFYSLKVPLKSLFAVLSTFCAFFYFFYCFWWEKIQKCKAPVCRSKYTTRIHFKFIFLSKLFYCDYDLTLFPLPFGHKSFLHHNFYSIATTKRVKNAKILNAVLHFIVHIFSSSEFYQNVRSFININRVLLNWRWK